MFKDPVTGDRFFGRNNVLAILEKRAEALTSGYRQNIAITGHRLTGKSSILNQFLGSLRTSDIIPIYIELTGESFKNFAKKFIGTLLYNYAKYSNKDLRDDLGYLMNECRQDIPETVAMIERVMKGLAKNDLDKAYSDLLSLSSSLKAETGKPCVVILDEFHNLSKLGLKQPYKGFGKKIMTQKDTMYIIASSEVNAIKNILSENLALLFGNFEKITISGFDHATSRAFMAKKLAAVKITPSLADFIIAFADGHPFYIDVITTKITELMGSSYVRWVSKATVARAMEELLFNASGIINQFFNNFLNGVLEGESETARDILEAIAGGNHRASDIAKTAGTSKKQVSGHMGHLIDRTLICRSGDFYLFHDKVLEFWLREVSYKRKRTLIDDRSERSRAFIAMVEGLIADSDAEADKPFDERLTELMREFNNEQISIDSKRHVLPKFSLVELICDDRGAYVRGSYNGKCVIAAIRRENIGENDVLDFLSICYEHRDKLSRMILIPLAGMDHGARLMAKEAKVWTWSLGNMNIVMDLFGKKKIVMDGAL